MVSINSYLMLYFITLFSSLLTLLLDFTNYFSQYFDLKIKYLCNVGISGKSFHFPIGQANVASLVCILTFNFQKCTYIIMKLCQFLIFNNTINRFIFYWFKTIRVFTKCSDFFQVRTCTHISSFRFICAISVAKNFRNAFENTELIFFNSWILK